MNGLLHIRHKDKFIVEYYISGKKKQDAEEYFKSIRATFSFFQKGLAFTFYVTTDLANVSTIHNGVIEKKLML